MNNTPVECILGMRFWYKAGVLLDSVDKVITFKRNPEVPPIPFGMEETMRMKSANFINPENGEMQLGTVPLGTMWDFSIAPGDTADVMMYCIAATTQAQKGIHKGLVTRIGKGRVATNLLATAVGSMTDGMIRVSVANITELPVRVPAKTVLGMFTPSIIDTEMRPQYESEEYEVYDMRNNIIKQKTQPAAATVTNLACPVYLQDTPRQPDCVINEDGLPSDLDMEKTTKEIGKQKTKELKAVIRRHPRAFAEYYGRPKLSEKTHMRIDIDEKAQPRYVPLRRTSPQAKLVIIDHVKRMLENDIIEPSRSPWSSGIVLTAKKDGSMRFAIDYRYLNSVTRPIASCLPRIDDTLDCLGGAQWYSTIDACSAYWTVGIPEEDRDCTAFSTPMGQFRWKRMPFGLKNSQQVYVQLTNFMLSGLQWEFCAAYVDDTICFSRTWKEHLIHLDKLLARFEEFGVCLKASKCVFASKKCHYMGHIIDTEGVRMNPTTTAAIREMPTPQNLRQLRRFLGMVNFWRRFIPRCARVIDPLRPLLKHGQWKPMTKPQLDAITALKYALAGDKVMVHPDWDLPFEVHTDASKQGIAGALLQKVDGYLRPVRYLSRSLTDNEVGYAVNEWECLAALWCVESWRSYLIGRRFTLITDQQSLTGMLKSTTRLCGRQTRWVMRLSEFTYDVHHRPGKLHVVPDCMSRAPCKHNHGASGIEALSAVHVPIDK